MIYFVFDPRNPNRYERITFTKLGARWATSRYNPLRRPFCHDYLSADDWYKECDRVNNDNA